MKNKKTEYLINNKPVSRTSFFNNLKNHSVSKTRTSNYGSFNIDYYDFDKAKYNKYKRKLNGSGNYAPVCLGFTDDYGKSQIFKIQKNRSYRR